MKMIRSYFSYAYRFMVDADIRYGEEFHFVPFFLLSVLFPLNVLLMVLLPAEHFIVLYSVELLTVFTMGLIFSFFPAFKRWLRRTVDVNVCGKKKLKFGAYLRGYLLIIGIAILPCLLVIFRILFDSIE